MDVFDLLPRVLVVDVSGLPIGGLDKVHGAERMAPDQITELIGPEGLRPVKAPLDQPRNHTRQGGGRRIDAVPVQHPPKVAVYLRLGPHPIRQHLSKAVSEVGRNISVLSNSLTE